MTRRRNYKLKRSGCQRSTRCIPSQIAGLTLRALRRLPSLKIDCRKRAGLRAAAYRQLRIDPGNFNKPVGIEHPQSPIVEFQQAFFT